MTIGITLCYFKEAVFSLEPLDLAHPVFFSSSVNAQQKAEDS